MRNIPLTPQEMKQISRLLPTPEEERLFADLFGGDLTAAFEIQRERNRFLSMQLEVWDRAGVKA